MLKQDVLYHYLQEVLQQLLRVSIEKLVYDILDLAGSKRGEDLNKSIGILVDKGLPVEIQQSLDYLRVTGNNAVHPLGVIDVDDYNTAIALFGLVNLVVENRITGPKQVNSYYKSLPQDIRDNIHKRDSKDTTSS